MRPIEYMRASADAVIRDKFSTANALYSAKDVLDLLPVVAAAAEMRESLIETVDILEADGHDRAAGDIRRIVADYDAATKEQT